MQRGLLVKNLWFVLSLITGLIGIIVFSRIQFVSACYFGYDYQCCSELNCGGTCHSTQYYEDDETSCSYDCAQNSGDYCCEDCADQCQADYECGSGCTCIADPYSNYCYCPGGGSGGGGGGGGGGNNPPSCSITVPLNNPNNIFYDAKEYLNQTTGQLETQQPTTRQGYINTSDPDGDNVSIPSLTTHTQLMRPLRFIQNLRNYLLCTENEADNQSFSNFAMP